MNNNNKLCETCQWLEYKNNSCACLGNENFEFCITDISLDNCDDYYNEDMIFNKDDGGLLDEAFDPSN